MEANAQAEAMFKTDRARLRELGPSELSPEVQPDGRASAEAAPAHIRQALVEGTAAFEWTHWALDGDLVPCEVRLLKLPGASGDLIRGSMVDLRPWRAKERHLLESESKFRLLFERSVEGLLLLDGDRFTDCNRAVLDMLGCTEPELLRLHPWELSPPVQPDGRPSEEKARDMIATAHARGVHRFEWMHRRMSGEDFPVEVTLIPIPLGGRTSCSPPGATSRTARRPSRTGSPWSARCSMRRSWRASASWPGASPTTSTTC
ncbi:MAG: PAS domain-containing protein [Holophagaceae bacterium]